MNKKILIAAILVAIIASVSIAVAFNGADNLTAGEDDKLSEEIEVDVLTDEDTKDDLNTDEDSPAVSDKEDDSKISSADNDKLAEEEYSQITVKKVWNDNNNAQGKRPDSIKFNISENGDPREFELSSADGWQKTYVDLHMQGDITLQEEAVDGYTTTVTGDAKNGFTITNTLKDQNNQTTPDDKKDDKKDDNQNDNQNDDDKKDDTPQKQTSKKTTKTVKKTPKKTKDKHKTGMPVLLGVMALSGAGLVLSLRRKE